MSTISSRLYELIQASNLSYSDLAKLTGIPKSALQRYATGETEKIPLDRVEKMAAALNSTAPFILGWDIGEIKKELANPVWDDEQARKNIELFSRLSLDKQQEALRYLQYLVDLKENAE